MVDVGLLALSALFAGWGLLLAVRPYRVARFRERTDAIGSRRSWSSVEPTDWNVQMTRIVGVGLALFGLLVAGLAFL